MGCENNVKALAGGGYGLLPARLQTFYLPADALTSVVIQAAGYKCLQVSLQVLLCYQFSTQNATGHGCQVSSHSEHVCKRASILCSPQLFHGILWHDNSFALVFSLHNPQRMKFLIQEEDKALKIQGAVAEAKDFWEKSVTLEFVAEVLVQAMLALPDPVVCLFIPRLYTCTNGQVGALGGRTCVPLLWR